MNYEIKDFKKYFLILFTILIYSNFSIVAFGINNEKPESYIVDISGNGNYTIIQEAIDNAKSGDIIYVDNGTYYENIVIDKSITLIGLDRNNTIIDGRGAGNVIKINSDDVKIYNFSIQNSGIYFPNSGINCSYNKNIIIFNNIINNCFYDITLYYSNNNIIQFNIIKDAKNCGIYITNSSYNYFQNNSIFNHTYNGIGIYFNSNKNIIKNNSFYKNGYCAVNIRTSSNNNIISNNISNNNIGIHIPSNENFVSDNYFNGNNIDIDKEIITPSFEIYLLIFSILGIICLFFIKRNIMKL
jgi:parallel beta-helix repeat protein